MTNEELNNIVEVRSSPELPEVDPLFWPKYDRGTWRAMHDFPVTLEFLKTLMDHIPNRNIMIQAGGNCGRQKLSRWRPRCCGDGHSRTGFEGFAGACA